MLILLALYEEIRNFKTIIFSQDLKLYQPNVSNQDLF